MIRVKRQTTFIVAVAFLMFNSCSGCQEEPVQKETPKGAKWQINLLPSYDLMEHTRSPDMPGIVGDYVITPGYTRGNMYCIEWHSGKVLWKHHEKGEDSDYSAKLDVYFTAPILLGETLVVRYAYGIKSPFLVGLNVKSGRFQWRYDPGGADFAGPALHNDKVVVIVDTGKVVTIDSEGKTQERKFSDGGIARPENGLIVYKDTAIFCTGGTVWRVNLETSTVQWKARHETAIQLRTPFVFEQYIIAEDYDHNTNDKHTFYVIDSTTGKPLANVGEDMSICAVVPYRDKIYIVTVDRGVLTFSPDTLEVHETSFKKGVSRVLHVDGPIMIVRLREGEMEPVALRFPECDLIDLPRDTANLLSHVVFITSNSNRCVSIRHDWSIIGFEVPAR